MSSHVKLQTTIPNSNIVIDYWGAKARNGHDPSIRFMTSMKNHSVEAVAQMRKANYLIYTSLFNRWFLHHFYEISEDRIVVLKYNETVEIFDPDMNEKIKVTSIEAHYCSGSSMFLFEGSFGNVLYTGFFRLSSADQVLSCPELKEIVDKNMLHTAYVDNSYAAENCNFPSRQEMTINIIQLIRDSGNCKIVISSNQWVKEEVFLAIASKLDEKVDVGPQRYSIFERIGLAELFTRQSKETRIRALDHLLTFHECQKMLKQDKSCVIILMTAIYMYGPKKFPSKSKYPRLYVIPYSGHCDHTELKEFVRIIRPHNILPVMRPKIPQKCSVIPQSIYDLCGKVDNPSPSVDDEDGGINLENCNPLVVLPRLQVSPLRLKRVNGLFCPSSTPVRKSPRSLVISPACDCTSEKANTFPPTRRSARLLSAKASAAKREKDRAKSTSNTPVSQPLPSTSNASPRSDNVSSTGPERSPKKPINVSVIRSISAANNSHPPAPKPSTSNDRLSANVSAVDQRPGKCTSDTHPQRVTNVESVTNVENIDEMPFTLRLQNADLIREDCRNVLLGSTSPRIVRVEHVEEVSAAPSVASEDSLDANDFVIEEYVVEESVASSDDICADGETNLSSSKNANEEVVQVDSADSSVQMDDAGETASTPEDLTCGIVEDDSCVLVESSRVNNGSHSPVRTSPNKRPSGCEDADLSDSDDCVVVCEYVRESETPARVPVQRAVKRLKLEDEKRNSRIVNAILSHYTKLYPQKTSKLAFDQWSVLSGLNIFSHFVYKRA